MNRPEFEPLRYKVKREMEAIERRVERAGVRVVCAWHEPAPTEIDLNVSHTICEPCKAKLLGNVGK